MIYAFDMGEKNTAWAIINSRGTLASYGELSHPINSLTDDSFNGQKVRFIKEIKSILSKVTKNDVILMERFQNRRFNAGKQTETVSLMIGIISTLASCPSYLILASTWKNYMLKKYKENTMENVFLPEYKSGKYSEHICDAIGIGLWYYETTEEKQSKWFEKYFPIPKDCSNCWFIHHGCKGQDKLCKHYQRLTRSVKCRDCSKIKVCLKTRLTFAKGAKWGITKTTVGCLKFKG